MTPSEALAHHLANPVPRPAASGPMPMDKYRVEMLAYEEWLFTKDRLEILNRIQAALPAETSSFGNFQNFPSSVQVKPKVVRPAWSGSTAEYMREKKRVSREKPGCVDCHKPKVPGRKRCIECQVLADAETLKRKSDAKTARRQLIREGLNERREAA